MLAQGIHQRNYPNYGFRARHECPHCWVSRSALADSLADAPTGSEDLAQTIHLITGCLRCLRVVGRWWRVYGMRRVSMKGVAA